MEEDGWLFKGEKMALKTFINMEYEMEFGSITGEFWFGLNVLHCLTSQGE